MERQPPEPLLPGASRYPINGMDGPQPEISALLNLFAFERINIVQGTQTKPERKPGFLLQPIFPNTYNTPLR